MKTVMPIAKVIYITVAHCKQEQARYISFKSGCVVQVVNGGPSNECVASYTAKKV